MKKYIVFCCLFSSFHLFSQDYHNAAGLRAGFTGGLTGKHFFNSQHAIEGIIGWRWGGASITGLFEIHQKAFDVDGLNWYYGGGVHVGFYESKYWYARSGKFDNQAFKNYNFGVAGIDGIIGIEYNIAEIPLTIGLDFKPSLSLGRHTIVQSDEFALSARYRFN